MPFPQVNRNTTTVMVLAPVRLFVCAFRVNLFHKTTTAGTFHNVYFTKQLGSGKLCVIYQERTHNVAFPGEAAEDRQERRAPAIDRRPDSACIVLPHRGSTQSECGLLLSMWCCVPFCPTPNHKTSRPPRARSCSWVWSSTWPRFWVCFFLGHDEHAADDEQARPLHEQARPAGRGLPSATSHATRREIIANLTRQGLQSSHKAKSQPMSEETNFNHWIFQIKLQYEKCHKYTSVGHSYCYCDSILPCASE